MLQLLENIFWHALTGPQAKFAAGSAGARRYAPGFSPIIAFAEPERPDFAALAACCEPDERFYSDGWRSAAPPGFAIELESTMFKLVWQGPLPADDAPDAIALDSSHADQAVALAELTRPGPFDRRTLELGDYFGYFDGPRLIAMAGERSQAGPLREVSGICTHPDHQGRGLARRLTTKILRRQLQRGQQPFLHVMRENPAARAMYARMGFREHGESVVRVVRYGA